MDLDHNLYHLLEELGGGRRRRSNHPGGLWNNLSRGVLREERVGKVAGNMNHGDLEG